MQNIINTHFAQVCVLHTTHLSIINRKQKRKRREEEEVAEQEGRERQTEKLSVLSTSLNNSLSYLDEIRGVKTYMFNHWVRYDFLKTIYFI